MESVFLVGVGWHAMALLSSVGGVCYWIGWVATSGLSRFCVLIYEGIGCIVS